MARGAAGGACAEDLDQRIEAWLTAEAEQSIDFEIADALAKLERLKIATLENGRWRALPIEQAIQALARRWSELPDTWQ